MNDSHSFTSQDNAFDMNLLYLPIKTLFLDKNSNKLTVTKPLGEVIGLTENGDPIYEGQINNDPAATKPSYDELINTEELDQIDLDFGVGENGTLDLQKQLQFVENLEKLIDQIRRQKDRKLSPEDLSQIIKQGLRGLEGSEKHLKALLDGYQDVNKLKDNLESKILSLGNQLQEKLQELKDAKQRIDNLDSLNTLAENRLREASEEKENIEDELNTHKNENMALKKSIDKFEKDLVDLEENNKSLKQQLNILNEQLGEKNDDLSNQVFELMTEMQKEQRNNERLSLEQEEIQKELAGQKKKNGELQQILGDQKDQISGLQDQLTRDKVTRDDLEAALKKQSKLTDKLDQENSRVNDLLVKEQRKI